MYFSWKKKGNTKTTKDWQPLKAKDSYPTTYFGFDQKYRFFNLCIPTRVKNSTLVSYKT